MPSTTTLSHLLSARFGVVCATALLGATTSHAACLDDAAVAQWVQSYGAGQPAPTRLRT